jgi:hypothetical protein
LILFRTQLLLNEVAEICAIPYAHLLETFFVFFIHQLDVEIGQRVEEIKALDIVWIVLAKD